MKGWIHNARKSLSGAFDWWFFVAKKTFKFFQGSVSKKDQSSWRNILKKSQHVCKKVDIRSHANVHFSWHTLFEKVCAIKELIVHTQKSLKMLPPQRISKVEFFHNLPNIFQIIDSKYLEKWCYLGSNEAFKIFHFVAVTQNDFERWEGES